MGVAFEAISKAVVLWSHPQAALSQELGGLAELGQANLGTARVGEGWLAPNHRLGQLLRPQRQPDERTFERLRGGQVTTEEAMVRLELVAELVEHVDLQEAQLDARLLWRGPHGAEVPHVGVKEEHDVVAQDAGEVCEPEPCPP